MNEYMSKAYDLALLAYKHDEIPIGAVIVKDNEIIGVGYNHKEENKDVTAHAEILAIKQASSYLDSWHLDECVLYTTLEPCIMCTGAILQSRISKVVYATASNRWDAMSHLIKDHTYNHNVELDCSNDQECIDLLQKYFKNKRLKK